MNSSKGLLVTALVNALEENITSAEVARFNDSIVQEIQLILKPNKNGKVGLAKVWRNFHLFKDNVGGLHEAFLMTLLLFRR